MKSRFITTQLNNWALKAGRMLESLDELLKATVLDSDYLGGDETVMNILEKGREKVRKDYVWGFKNRDHNKYSSIN